MISIGIYVEIGYNKTQNEIINNIVNDDPEISVVEENIDSEKNDSSTIETKDSGIALLDIPAINLKAGIVEGVSQRSLSKGVAHYPNTPMPGEDGNVVLAGHDSGKMPIFRKLHKLNNGDRINVTYKTKVYEYVVTGKRVVKPSQTDILDSSDAKTITLFTCTEKGNKRLVVTGTPLESFN